MRFIINYRKFIISLMFLFVISCTNDNIVESKQPDYFPIRMNMQKKFNYSYYSYNGMYNYNETGISIWDMKSLSINGDTTKYIIRESMELTKTTTYSNGSISRIDTVYQTITINEDKNHMIKIYIPNFGYGSFNRYLFPEDGEIQVLGFGEGNISLKNHVGIIEISRAGFRYSSSYKLIQ